MSDFDLDKILSSVSKIRLPGGVVGKTCVVLIVIALAMAAIAWSVRVVWISAMALIFIFVLCGIMLWRLITFADRNPKAALLEGAEFLLHEQLLKLGKKDDPTLTVDPKEIIEFNPVSSEKAIKEAEKPDAPSDDLDREKKGASNG